MRSSSVTEVGVTFYQLAMRLPESVRGVGLWSPIWTTYESSRS